MLYLLKSRIYSKFATSGRFLISKCVMHKFSTSHRVLKQITPANSQAETIRFLENSIRKIGIFDEIDLAPAQLNWEYLLDEKNFEKINSNIQNRKARGDISAVVMKTYYVLGHLK